MMANIPPKMMNGNFTAPVCEDCARVWITAWMIRGEFATSYMRCPPLAAITFLKQIISVASALRENPSPSIRPGRRPLAVAHRCEEFTACASIRRTSCGE